MKKADNQTKIKDIVAELAARPRSAQEFYLNVFSLLPHEKGKPAPDNIRRLVNPKPAHPLFPTGISHSEMLSITELTADRLLTWYKRSLLPSEEFPQEPGRGNRRRYDAASTLFLLLARALGDAGLPVNDAVYFAERFRVNIRALLGIPALSNAAAEKWTVEDFGKHVRDASGGSKTNLTLCAILPKVPGCEYYDTDDVLLPGVPRFETDRYVALSLESGDTEIALRRWMRSINTRSMMIIDVPALAVEYCCALDTVLMERKKKARR